MNPAIAGRPDLMAGRKTLTVYQGMTGMSENTFINIKNQTHSITADVVVPKNGANGVLLAQGGRFGGWALYVKDGKPVYTYNWLGLNRYSVASQQRLAPGKATIRFEFAYDGGGAGKGGLGTILVNGNKVAEARIDQTQCCVFSLDEAADVGRNDGTRSRKTTKFRSPSTGQSIR
jgi:hypothetical protein